MLYNRVADRVLTTILRQGEHMTLLITVFGIVQGVGYRPFVARLAEELKVAGSILNCGGIVQIVADSPSDALLDQFIQRLRADQPAGADVIEIQTAVLPDSHPDGFHIVQSSRAIQTDGMIASLIPRHPLIPADLPLCETCRQELYDPRNRRYLYPFISCVACGPRYSIIKDLPYDRDTVTMDIFPMCPACATEYTANLDRRRHAQTISCHDCGPQLILRSDGRILHRKEALDLSIRLLREGGVLALKGIGGYQLACLPSDEKAAQDLRQLKKRDKKPFAVMFPDMESLQDLCEVCDSEQTLLASAARPIVLLRKKAGKDFRPSVCGESRFIGAFLPYTPLHQLLTDACGPLVMTSANLSSNPILYRDEDMLEFASPFLSGVLYNERRITTPLDDSVARIVPGCRDLVQIIRRSRGYVPAPVLVRQRTAKAVLAMGGDLKSSFCLYHGDRAYISQYFGDMENPLVSKAYQENIVRMESLFEIRPEAIACDLHPLYFTTGIADRLAKASQPAIPVIPVQHHHAHAASVMAEHNLDQAIGVIFDGTGYGTDGAIWGGEFLLCRDRTYERLAHLGYVTLCGGDLAARNARLASQCYRIAADPAANEAVDDSEEMALLRSAIRHQVNTSLTSSMGRLFDAVSAVLCIRDENTFEAECAIALENEAVKFAENSRNGVESEAVHFDIAFGPRETIVDQAGLFKSIRTLAGHVDPGALAFAFHMAVAEMVRRVCLDIREKTLENIVVLSGGVFANMLLLQECIRQLEDCGFDVRINARVPSNDGGICLGQAWLCRD